jgi:hypothetical protein
MKEIDFKTYKLLKDHNEVFISKLPKRVINSTIFNNLLSSGIIEKIKKGKGFKIIVSNQKAFNDFFSNNFPNQSNNISKSSNIKKYRDSKATKIKNDPIFLIRGFKKAIINNIEIDLKYYSESFGLFSTKKPIIETNKVCFVENLDTFLKAEKIFNNEFIYLHKYGRIGKESIQNINANEYLVFVDYDFNGLDEYLRIKSVFPNATLYVPENFDELFKKYSKSLHKNKAKMSNIVKNSKLKEVIKIRDIVAKTNHFLEQEILTDD